MGDNVSRTEQVVLKLQSQLLSIRTSLSDSYCSCLYRIKELTPSGVNGVELFLIKPIALLEISITHDYYEKNEEKD